MPAPYVVGWQPTQVHHLAPRLRFLRFIYRLIVARLRLGGRDVADRLEEAPGVEPVHPFEGGELDRFEWSPGPAAPDDLRLEQPDDGPGRRVAVGISDAADRRLDPRLDQA